MLYCLSCLAVAVVLMCLYISILEQENPNALIEYKESSLMKVIIILLCILLPQDILSDYSSTCIRTDLCRFAVEHDNNSKSPY